MQQKFIDVKRWLGNQPISIFSVSPIWENTVLLFNEKVEYQRVAFQLSGSMTANWCRKSQQKFCFHVIWDHFGATKLAYIAFPTVPEPYASGTWSVPSEFQRI